MPLTETHPGSDKRLPATPLVMAAHRPQRALVAAWPLAHNTDEKGESQGLHGGRPRSHYKTRERDSGAPRARLLNSIHPS